MMNKGIPPRAQTQGLIRNFSAKSVPGASQYLPRFCRCYGQSRAIDPLISLPNERSSKPDPNHSYFGGRYLSCVFCVHLSSDYEGHQPVIM